MQNLVSRPLILAGAGKIGSIMLAGWLREGFPKSQLIIQDPSPSPMALELIEQNDIPVITSLNKVSEIPSVIFMAVKPQIMDAVFPPLAKIANSDTLVISVAAGRTMESFEKYLPKHTAVVRSIPNTPASIGSGITVCISNSNTNEKQKLVCNRLLSPTGKIVWIDDETLMDAVTAISGSGPAYVFLLAECLAQAGMRFGLSKELSERLANATVSGAGDLIRMSKTSPLILRENVTSAGGTTQAALNVLMAKNELRNLIEKAVSEAFKRSLELSK
ncbi:MAG: Pyrroline-5-carboxylate reductase [Hyphomicrobiaceae bacterium hypho_1]